MASFKEAFVFSWLDFKAKNVKIVTVNLKSGGSCHHKKNMPMLRQGRAGDKDKKPSERLAAGIVFG